LENLKTVSAWKSLIIPALESKSSEFRLQGYEEATSEDVWKCLTERVWKGNPEKRLYEVVQDIFHLGSNVYMSYLTLNAYQENDLMDSIAALTVANEEHHKT